MEQLAAAGLAIDKSLDRLDGAYSGAQRERARDCRLSGHSGNTAGVASLYQPSSVIPTELEESLSISVDLGPSALKYLEMSRLRST
jgi:hypothetical protein